MMNLHVQFIFHKCLSVQINPNMNGDPSLLVHQKIVSSVHEVGGIILQFGVVVIFEHPLLQGLKATVDTDLDALQTTR